MRSALIAFVAAALSIAGCNSRSPTQAFLHWDIDSCLGLLGGPTPEQLAPGKPPIRSAAEIKALEDAEKAACTRYVKVVLLYLVGSKGGEAEKLAALGYELSRAQARLAWANGKASLTVARLEQAAKFADRWQDAAQAAYEAETVGLIEVLSAAQAKDTAAISLDRVRSALEQLGYDLSDVPQQPQIDVAHPDPEHDCDR